MAGAMECFRYLPKVKSQSYKATGTKLRLQNFLVWSGNSLNTKGQNLEIDYFREELFHVCDEVT